MTDKSDRTTGGEAGYTAGLVGTVVVGTGVGTAAAVGEAVAVVADIVVGTAVVVGSTRQLQAGARTLGRLRVVTGRKGRKCPRSEPPVDIDQTQLRAFWPWVGCAECTQLRPCP